MTGFSPAWLALREPADHAARNIDVATTAAAYVDKRLFATIIDLGSGTGSNFRALSPLVATRQAWTFVDNDRGLLDAARDLIDAAPQPAARPPTLSWRVADLVRDIDAVLAAPAHLVTAAAFFDLVSFAWIEGFCAALARRRLPLYAALTYDGLEEWRPAHDCDTAVLAAFHAHQHGDKGFGPAAGPAAHLHLCKELTRHGYQMRVGDSPWMLRAEQRVLMSELAAGIADAAAATGTIEPPALAAWRQARLAATSARIGHQDVFAWL